VLAIVYADGRRADIVFSALARGGTVERLALISAGPFSGRKPASLPEMGTDQSP
jgi:hypothetical protein